MKHCKVRDTLTELRSTYWVPQGRRTVSRVIKSCVTCNKLESKPFQALPTAPHPRFRVTADFAFSSTGIDYLGPLQVKNIFGTKNQLYKVHIVLYTCASSRVVSLDLVPDASCLSFFRSLKRFIARRGISQLYLSDNATCFTGPELTSFLHRINSEWKFILQVSPLWGGFWERLVQSTKRCLKKTLEKSKLTYEELLTVTVVIEGLLNSRPLCYVYDDPTDNVITPSHLMIGRRLLSAFYDDAEPENNEFSPMALTRISKYINELLLHFWYRWKREYLTEQREFHNCKNRFPKNKFLLVKWYWSKKTRFPKPVENGSGCGIIHGKR